MKISLPGNLEKEVLRLETKPLQIELPAEFGDVRSPKPLFDGRLWHIYGIATKNGREEFLHLTADEIDSTWKLGEKLKLHNFATPELSSKQAIFSAPGVFFDSNKDQFDLFLHTNYSQQGGLIQHFISDDSVNFEYHDTVHLTSEEKVANSSYDPYPVVVNGHKYLTYTALNQTKFGMPWLAESKTGSWNGPWQNKGTLTSIRELMQFDNIHQAHWHLSNSQVIELSENLFLLLATRTFDDSPQLKQSKLLTAYGTAITGPFKIMGNLINQSPNAWDGGDLCHGGSVITPDKLNIFYTARSVHTEGKYRFGIAELDLSDLVDYLSSK